MNGRRRASGIQAGVYGDRGTKFLLYAEVGLTGSTGKTGYTSGPIRQVFFTAKCFNLVRPACKETNYFECLPCPYNFFLRR